MNFNDPVSRRGFLFRVAAVGVVVAVGAHILDRLIRPQGGIDPGGAVAGGPKIPATSQPPRPDAFHVLSDSGRKTLEALTAVVIPSDETGPGAREVGVVDEIERMLHQNQVLFERYSEGLQAFDDLALRRSRMRFHQLASEDQIELFALIEEAKGRLWLDDEQRSLIERTKRKLYHWYYRHYIGVTDSTMILFDQVIKDVSDSFYATRLAWDSVGYSGPPFPFGYVGRLSACSIPS
jgi:hypothetical protein